MSKASVLVFVILNAAPAQMVTLVNTIPTGNLAAQPPALTGAVPILGGGGQVIADAFPVEVTATLDQVTVAVQYLPLPNGLGTSPMLLTILSDNNNSPGTPIESWTVPFSPAETNLTLVTVTSATHTPLNSGQVYWISVVPTDPTTTGIGWGLVAASPNSPGLPIATSSLGINSGWGPTHASFANEFSVTGTTAPPPILPFAYSAENSASYGSSVAPGSIFVVYGSNLATGPVVQANTYPLPLALNGASITVTSGPTIVSCPMVYAGSDTVAAVLPSSVPPGKAMMTVSYNGRATPYPTPFDVAPTAPGLYTLGSSGEGPGVFTASDGSAKSFEATAKTGETVTLWATGLGPAAGPDNALPPTFPNFPGIDVFVGTQPATVIYAGRSGCCVGLDQISFVVPDGVQGCYVPVAVRSGSPSQSAFSNFVSLAVSSGGGPCSDTAPTLPVSIMNQATAGQPVTVAALAAGPVSVLQGLGFDVRVYIAQKLSTLLHAKVSVEDVARLLHAQQNHNQRAFRKVMTKYAASWKALSPSAKAAVQAALTPNQEGAVAGLGRYNSPAGVAAAVGVLFPSQGTCTSLPTVPVSKSAVGLDAGASLAFSGQAGSFTMPLTRTGEYQTLFGSAPSGRDLPPGSYTVTGTGGSDVSAFSARLNVGGNVLWTNKAAISTVDRSQPLTVTWTGGTSPGYVLIGGYVDATTGAQLGFVCSEDVNKGSFTIPAFILSTLPAESGGMFVSPNPLSQQISIPGVDLAYFMDGSNDAKSLGYR
jgi:uncharacterized protein (TIGR03437 family)